MIKLLGLRHSIYSRIVVLACLSALSITFVLWILTDTTISRANQIALERAVDVDMAGLVDIYTSNGLPELQDRIADRIALEPRKGTLTHYMLVGGQGQRLAGDLTRWPDLHASLSQTGKIAVDRNRHAYGRVTQLGPNLRLLVAHEARDLNTLRRQVGFVFFAGGLIIVAAVALTGLIAVRRLATRIERLNTAFRTPDDTALEALSRHLENEDEIGELTRHSANALARLRRLASANRETTDHVAHEIRTPLMHLDNRLVKTLAATPDPETARRIASARSEIRRIIRMLESLLDIAASQARRGDRHGLVPVDLSEIAQRLGELYADSAEETGHALILDIEPDVVIPGEEMALTRLITNLLDNAFKFVPKGGTITLALEAGPRLTVRDDGPGIPEGQREQVFEKFSRAGQHPEGNGAGLGLTLCRAIAQRHHLEITLVDTPQGACFTVTPETMT
ncbi:sensor histidine kinase [Novosphingobium profundi]|uniref:sensor histidine kinase n=1 Tax=Novosphingobium profundi TaxID=1774954 RepID=UPI001CFC558D|nr:HAMP domain-containing sensor histidine kinase [Novosphingobium profundi]